MVHPRLLHPAFLGHTGSGKPDISFAGAACGEVSVSATYGCGGRGGVCFAASAKETCRVWGVSGSSRRLCGC